jgi:hypothetical protein
MASSRAPGELLLDGCTWKLCHWAQTRPGTKRAALLVFRAPTLPSPEATATTKRRIWIEPSRRAAFSAPGADPATTISSKRRRVS